MNKQYMQTESYWLKIIYQKGYKNEENHILVTDNLKTE